jgi:hypothetical protein
MHDDGGGSTGLDNKRQVSIDHATRDLDVLTTREKSYLMVLRLRGIPELYCSSPNVPLWIQNSLVDYRATAAAAAAAAGSSTTGGGTRILRPRNSGNEVGYPLLM